jgi:AcrR family transcriptional regulator
VSNKSVRRRVKRASIDKRSLRTRGALAMALIDLVPHHGIDTLEVRKLAAAAGVGRSTFYKHYADKSDFLIKSFAGMVGAMDARARRDRRDYDTMLPAAEVFHHVEEARAFALSLAASGGFARTIAQREDVLQAVAEQNLKRLRPGLSLLRRQETAVVLAGVFMSLMRWWMEGGMRRRADDVAALYDAAARRLLQG